MAHYFTNEENLKSEIEKVIAEINGIPYSEIVKTAKEYIDAIGGFEKLGEWGLW